MNFQFTHPYYLLLLAPALAWVIWFAWKTDVQVSPWRRWTALVIRVVVLIVLVFAIAGFQWLRPVEGMNVFFALDRSDSVPSPQQESAREYVNRISKEKKKVDKAGVIVFGAEASIESSPNAAVDVPKIQAVVGTERTDLAAAIRLATAAGDWPKAPRGDVRRQRERRRCHERRGGRQAAWRDRGRCAYGRGACQ